jgi:hypothetical protein
MRVEAERIENLLEKQRLLYGKQKDARTLRSIGESFFQANRLFEALEFFAASSFTEGLIKIRDLSKQEGDYFLFKKTKEFLKEQITTEELEEVAKNAKEKGKLLYCENALREKESNQKN